MKLAELIVQYVAFRRNLGEKCERDAKLLQSFARMIGETVDISEVQAGQVKAFLDGSGPITRFWRMKYTALRGFYRYAASGSLQVTGRPRWPASPSPGYWLAAGCSNIGT